MVAGAGIDGWKLVSVGSEYWALNEQYPKVRALLEMAGTGQPRILAWERKKPPHSGFGVLRYAAGSIVAAQGVVTQESVAVLDVTTGAVVGVAVAKLGGKDARLDWGDGQLSVIGADGLGETFRLTTVMKEDREVAAAVVAPRKLSQPSNESTAPKKTSGTVPTWSPWANTGPSPASSGQREAKPKPKPKSIFDMLFGN